MTYPRMPLKRLGNVLLGKMLQPNAKAFADVAAPYLRAAHIQPQGRLIDVDEKAMWFEQSELELYNLRADDVVIVEGGAGYGRSAVLLEDRPGWGFQNSIVRVRPRPSLAIGRYLNYALQSALANGEVEMACFTATIPHFTGDKVAAFLTPAPPLEQQRAIADYLDRETARIDTLVEEQQRLIEILRERRLLVVQHIVPWDGKRGRMKWDTEMLAGATPATDVEDNWLGDEDGGMPFVTIADMSRRSSVRSTARRLTRKGMASREMPAGQPGTLLLAMYASVGEVAVLEIEATWNQAILGITPDPRKLDVEFLRYSLLGMRTQLLRDVRSNTQANLNASQVGDLWIPVPSLEEQRRVVKNLNEQTAKVDSLIAETERFIELCRERRSALITAAVTGQIDVRDVA